MQYTASSFSEFLLRLFEPVLRPTVHRPGRLALFPRTGTFRTYVADLVLERAVLPAAQIGAQALVWFRWFQPGRAHIYLVYILIVVVLLHFYR
jgi:hypothetical protein